MPFTDGSLSHFSQQWLNTRKQVKFRETKQKLSRDHLGEHRGEKPKAKEIGCHNHWEVDNNLDSFFNFLFSIKINLVEIN